ncbi:unnamed protein product [Fraxinus pennsylvanica]|uniref:Uncharacterized protein n=1 Tax=Fraxinus pennsylvanica TaxID=56036 RepID=A0AAD1YVK9_9LAMI|nr:unnamed protein product [Fraxinus pennsylvanica]
MGMEICGDDQHASDSISSSSSSSAEATEVMKRTLKRCEIHYLYRMKQVHYLVLPGSSSPSFPVVSHSRSHRLQVWPPQIDVAEFDRLPRLLVAAFTALKADMKRQRHNRQSNEDTQFHLIRLHDFEQQAHVRDGK